eukprot:PhM_4_TR769/c0_g1_i1/m.39650
MQQQPKQPKPLVLMYYCCDYYVLLTLFALAITLLPDVAIALPRTVSVTPSSISLGGGIPVTVYGTGFNTNVLQESNNIVRVGDTTCTLDPMYTATGRLLCRTVPPVSMSLVDGSFLGASRALPTDSIAVTVEVMGVRLATDDASLMMLSYTEANTPVLSDVSHTASVGSRFFVRGALITRIPAQMEILLEPHEVRCDMMSMLPTDEYVSDAPGSERHYACRINDIYVAGYYNVSVSVTPDYMRGTGVDSPAQNGRAITDPKAIAKIFKMHMSGSVYVVEALPSIRRVSPTAIGSAGGVRITIEGYGFSTTASENNVTIGGAPCDVVSPSATTLVCVTRVGAGQPQSQYIGSAGLAETRYNNIFFAEQGTTVFRKKDLQLHPAYMHGLPAYTGVWLQDLSFSDFLEYGTHGQAENMKLSRASARVLDGYFIPPYTSTYTFYVAGNDMVELWLAPSPGTDVAPTLAAWAQTSPNDPIGVSRYYYDATSTSRTAFKSRGITLEAGKAYHMQVIHMDYTGDDMFSVAVSHTASHDNGAIQTPFASKRPYHTVPQQYAITVSPNQGEFRLVFPDHNATTASLTPPTDCTTWSLVAAIETKLLGSHVLEHVVAVPGTSRCRFYLSFPRPQGPIAMYATQPAAAAVEDVLEGSYDPFYDPIPLSWVRRPAKGAMTVDVRVNNLPVIENTTTMSAVSLLAGATPTFTGLDPQTVMVGSKVYLFGTNFVADPSEIRITVGDGDDALCTDVTVNVDMTRIVCTVPAVTPGLQQVKLSMGPWGTPIGNPRIFVVKNYITSISPKVGSIYGGCNITITGLGFPAGVTSDLSVKIRDAPCSILTSTSTYIVCTTPGKPEDIITAAPTVAPTPSPSVTNAPNASNATDAPTAAPTVPPTAPPPTVVQTSWSYDVVVTYNSMPTTSPVKYTYSIAATPMVTSVSPAIIMGGDNAVLTVTGRNLDGDTTLMVCSKTCRPCVADLATVTSTYAQCAPSLPSSGAVSVLALSARRGLSNINETVDVRFTITNVNPVEGSNAGGGFVTIHGVGFGPAVRILVGTTTAGVECLVQRLTNTSIECQLSENTADLAGSHPISVFGSYEQSVIGGMTATCLASTGCSYTFNQTLTPIITNIVPKEGQRTAITISGQNFFGAATIRVGSVSCPVVDATTTQIICALKEVSSAGAFPVHLTIDPYGLASVRTTNSYIFPLTLTSITPTVGGVAGGTTITVFGQGFDLTLNRYSVLIAGKGICTVLSVTRTSLVCRTEELSPTDDARGKPQTLSGPVRVTLEGVSSKTCCEFRYDSAVTPVVESIEPSSGSFGQFISIIGSGFDKAYGANVTLSGVYCLAATVQQSDKITCVLQEMVASVSYVKVLGQYGFAWRSAKLPRFSFELEMSGVTPSTSSYFGGRTVTIVGQGFKMTAEDKMNVQVCGMACAVTSYSYSRVTCVTPRLPTYETVQSYPLEFPAGQLVGIDTLYDPSAKNAQSTRTYASDGNVDTVFEGNYYGVFLGESVGAFLSEVHVFPDPDPAKLAAFSGAFVEVAHTNATTGPWYTIMTIGTPRLGWNRFTVAIDQVNSRIDAIRFPQYLRIRGKDETTQLSIAELKFFGRVISNTTTDMCRVDLTLKAVGSLTVRSLAKNVIVTYSRGISPTVSSIHPSNGTAAGGTVVTLSGFGFGNTASDVQVAFDGKKCEILSAQDGQVVCRTSPRGRIYNMADLGTVVTVQGRGTAGLLVAPFLYADPWSSPLSWVDYHLPQAGENVIVPLSRTIILDMTPPALNLLQIDGNLIIDPNADIELTANYILIMPTGSLVGGTATSPLYRRFQITLTGDPTMYELPVYGAKVLAVHGGKLSLHGLQKSPTWTRLAQTAHAGDRDIVIRGAVNWVVGDTFVLSAGASSYLEAEHRVIADIVYDSTNKQTQLVFTVPLVYTHYGSIETTKKADGTRIFSVDMSAEVGVLTRNVKITGDRSSTHNRFGGHLVVRNDGDGHYGSLALSYVEVAAMGQYGKEHRHAVNLLKLDDASTSAVVGCAIHTSYNRGIVVHGTRGVTLSSNVVYNTIGHGIMSVTGTERFLVVTANLVTQTHPPPSGEATDAITASFFFAHPQITFDNNAAGGSSHVGVWLSLPQSPRFDAFTGFACPDRAPLGTFSRISTHSNGRMGLWVFPQHYPQALECGSLNLHDNPIQLSSMSDIRAWKNGEHGVSFANVGGYVVSNVRVADNAEAGVVFGDVVSPGVTLRDSIFLAQSAGNSPEQYVIPRPTNIGTMGVITPKSEGFFGATNTFIGFSAPTFMTQPRQQSITRYAVMTCASCWSSSSTEIGGFTSQFEATTFVDSTHRVYLGAPSRDQVIDVDGTFFARGRNTSLVPAFGHLVDIPGCYNMKSLAAEVPFVVRADKGALLCNGSTSFHRTVVFGVRPEVLAESPFRTLQVSTGNYFDATASSSVSHPWSSGFLTFLPSNTPSAYKLFSSLGADFTNLGLWISSAVQWRTPTLGLELNYTSNYVRIDVFPVTAVRWTRELRRTSLSTATGPRSVIPTYYSSVKTTVGTSAFLDLDKHVLNLQLAHGYGNDNLLAINTVLCPPTGCLRMEPLVDPPETYNWTDIRAWPNNALPKGGESITIPPGKTIIVNTNTPIMERIIVQGRLVFSETRDVHLQARYLVVYGGSLEIGTATQAYARTATITLHGESTDGHLGVDTEHTIEGGTMAIFGKIIMNGIERPRLSSTLTRTASAGSTSIQLQDAVDWSVGETIAISSSGYDGRQDEIREILSIGEDRRTVTVAALTYTHYSDSVSYETHLGTTVLATRTKVALLNRNIIVQSAQQQPHGCQMLLGEYGYNEAFFASGSVKNVQVRYCGRTGKQGHLGSTVLFDRLQHFGVTFAHNSVHHSNAESIVLNRTMYSNVTENVFYRSYGSTVVAIASNNNIFQSNLAFGTRYPSPTPTGTYALCSYESIEGVNTFISNVAAGSASDGFCIYLAACGTASKTQTGNEAHSNVHGFIGAGTGCLEVHGLHAWHNSYLGLYLALEADVTVTNLLAHDNHISATFMRQGSGTITVYNGIIGGRTDAFSALECAEVTCVSNTLTGGCGERAELYGDGSYDFRATEVGILISRFSENTKKAMYDRSELPLPHPRLHDVPAEHGRVFIDTVTFMKFAAPDDGGQCGGGYIFATMGIAPDRLVPHILSKITLVSITHIRKIYMHRPSPLWETPSMCGTSENCDSLNHEYVLDSDGTFTGVRPTTLLPAYNVRNVDICRWEPTWQGYMCPTYSYGELYAKSMDDDSLTRPIAPLQVRSELDLDNIIVAQQPPECYGECTYTGKRLGRAYVAIETNRFYHVDFEYMPPRRAVLNFDNCVPGESLRSVVKVRYPEVMPVTVWAGGQYVAPVSNGIDEKFTLMDHGANYFDELERQMHIVMLCGGAEVEVHQLVQARVGLRVDVDIESFYQLYEQVFASRIASYLKVNASRVALPDVHPGSTIAEFTLSALDTLEYNSTQSALSVNDLVRGIVNTSPEVLSEALKMPIGAVEYVTWAEALPPPKEEKSSPDVIPLWVVGVIVGAIAVGVILALVVLVAVYKKIMAFQEQLEEDEHAGKEIVFPDFAQPGANTERIFDVRKKDTGEIHNLKLSIADDDDDDDDGHLDDDDADEDDDDGNNNNNDNNNRVLGMDYSPRIADEHHPNMV